MLPEVNNLVSNIEEMDRKFNRPDYLYHYTTPAGLLGIFETKSIWLTHSSFLNDAKEFIYTQELFLKLLNHLCNNPSTQDEKELAGWLSMDMETRMYPFFSFSLSAHKDD